MHNQLINYFKKITDLTDDEARVLTESMVVKKVKKDDYLIKEGQLNSDTWFVLEGCVRQFKLVDGNDITTNFFTAEQWILSLDNFDGQKPSGHSLICMEDTQVVTGNEQKAQELFKQFPRFETVSRQIVERAFFEQQTTMASYITDSPEQRYLKLLKSRPDIFQLVPQYHIASYLGVKSESLSRIRKRIIGKN